MTSQGATVLFCKRLRFAAITVLILTVGELILGKLLNRIMISPDLGIVLSIISTTFAGVAWLSIKTFKKDG